MATTKHRLARLEQQQHAHAPRDAQPSPTAHREALTALLERLAAGETLPPAGDNVAPSDVKRAVLQRLDRLARQRDGRR